MIQTSVGFWDDLLELIEEQRVIPIVGSELLRIPHKGTDAPLHYVLAIKLAERLSIPTDGLPLDDALNWVICRHIEKGGRREEIYPRMRSILKETVLPTPDPLKKLAQIRHFNLFVTTTFDSLLEGAINQVRFDGAPRTKTIAYSPNNVQDLPGEIKTFDSAVVFHLLGRLSAAPEYVITQEDMLEFLYAMQSEKRRPELLFDELKNSSLLLIGNSFPDWLARFFIRLAKGGRLSGQRDSLEVLADATSRSDKSLVLFLKNFSYRTQVFSEGGSVEFVNELAARYLQRHPLKTVNGDEPLEPQYTAGDDEMPDRAVFISYASQDINAAEAIYKALKEANVTVWFDRARLEGGDAYDRKIRRNIKNCSLFVPLISNATRSRLEGYFRLEWRLAVERSMQFDDSLAFIVPVAIDDTPNSEDAIVPDRFLDVHWTRLPDGAPSPQLIELIVRLIRARRKREKDQL